MPPLDRSLRDRVRRVLASTVAAAWTTIMLVVFWAPAPAQPQTVEWADEAVHAGSFFGYAILWAIARVRLPWIAGLGLVLAIVTELVQSQLPWPRTAQLGDVIADGCGVLVGLAVVLGARRLAA